MNTNYKFTTRHRVSPNSAWSCLHCIPQNYVLCQPWPFPYNPNPYAPVAPQQPMYQPTYEWHPDTVQQQFPRNPFMPPQQPMIINGRFLTNEDESFFIDLSPVLIKLNAFSCELTGKHICSIDFKDVRIESNTSRYKHYGPLTATAYINKDGSIDFILWCPYAGDDEEFIDLSNSKLYKRTFTTVEIKSVGDHCMEKLLVAFMNEALTAD